MSQEKIGNVLHLRSHESTIQNSYLRCRTAFTMHNMPEAADRCFASLQERHRLHMQSVGETGPGRCRISGMVRFDSQDIFMRGLDVYEAPGCIPSEYPANHHARIFSLSAMFPRGRQGACCQSYSEDNFRYPTPHEYRNAVNGLNGGTRLRELLNRRRLAE